MVFYICKTCGTQYSQSKEPPAYCLICEDDRQYIGFQGQEWTTLQDLRQDHHNVFKTLEAGLIGIGTQPDFAIAQRALLVQSQQGNVLWDCIPLIDDYTISQVNALGGISAIAISHPHYYSTMVEWARIFDAPIYLHSKNRRYVARPDSSIVFWDGDIQEMGGGMRLIRCGGHFPGSVVLHWADGAGGKGALLSGDTVTVAFDRKHVSFMYSYPNLVPLAASTVRRIAAAIEPYPFERIYGAWWPRVILADGKAAVKRSVDRYLAALEGRFGEQDLD
ncbi:MAG: MBL fold metallo-hydrolase [Anaerolineae bacterium]|nr:MBL fold metallo-hydrolase [Anaerolineae bacterium]